jgi:hypothetical protein
MNIRTICEGQFTLPLSVASAVPLFTPEGERRWAGSSWDPIYAIPEAAADDSVPGTVFSTHSDSGSATWIVLERRDDGMSYARVAAGFIAGTISVTCSPASSLEESWVTVRYDVTSLGAGGAVFVEELEATYDAVLGDWRREILAGLANERDAAVT